MLLRFKIDTSAVDPATRPFIYHEVRGISGTPISYVETSVVSGGYIHTSYVATGNAYFNTYCIIGLTSDADFSGSSTLVVSEAIWVHLKADDPDPDWFDGDSAGAQWLGTPYNSYSMIGKWRQANTMRFNGTEWVDG